LEHEAKGAGWLVDGGMQGRGRRRNQLDGLIKKPKEKKNLTSIERRVETKGRMVFNPLGANRRN